MNTVNVVGIAPIKDGKILLGRSWKAGDLFNFIGGKPEEGESDIECIKREVVEEISVEVDESSITFLSEFEAPAWGRENTNIHLRLYKCDLLGEPKASSEIVEIQWFDSTVDIKHLPEVSKKVFVWLKEKNLIN